MHTGEKWANSIKYQKLLYWESYTQHKVSLGPMPNGKVLNGDM